MDQSLSINYSVHADNVVRPDFLPFLRRMKAAHVTDVWLWGLFSGRHSSTPETMVQAKHILEEEGFGTGIIFLPVGHPGNSLNPDDENVELRLPANWTYRADRDGEPIYYCGCINEALLEDNAAGAALYRDMGFTRQFMDDDARLGNWRGVLQGCYCDACIKAFSHRVGTVYTRPELVAALEESPALAKEWAVFTCEKVTALAQAVHVPGVQPGIMIMHDGDERHGIDIKQLAGVCDDMMFRVGEYYFDDIKFGPRAGKLSLITGAMRHMDAIHAAAGAHYPHIYTETTVFPQNRLTPDNLFLKARMELVAGLPRLYLMSGTAMLGDVYWQRFIAGGEELQVLRAQAIAGDFAEGGASSGRSVAERAEWVLEQVGE